jgi:hypothetical protein
MFKNEIRFSMEAKKIIKTIQFRLEDYKKEFLEKQKAIQTNNPGYELKNSKNNFFSRVNMNKKIGIEFNKPNL